MNSRQEEVRKWLIQFNECVRNIDYEGGKQLFHQDAYCFGSFTHILNGLDELVEKQWKKIWPNITDFTLNLDRIYLVMGQSEDLACVIMPWTSIGYSREQKPFPRPGRVTILLQWDNDKQGWLAVHSHFSLDPSL